MTCCTLYACWLQVVTRTDVGLGEAYMAGDYLVDDLGGFMALMVRLDVLCAALLSLQLLALHHT